MAEGTRCPPARIAGEDDSPAFVPDHTDTGGVGLTGTLETLDDPRAMERVPHARAMRLRPVGGRGARVGASGVGDMPDCADLAALLWGLDGEVAE